MSASILAVLFLIIVSGCGAKANDEAVTQTSDQNILERIANLEGILREEARSREVLREQITQEFNRRLSLENLLLSSINEAKVKVDELSSRFQTDHDRLATLDEMLREKMVLRGNGEILDEDRLGSLERKIGGLERDLTVISIFDSRLREMKDHDTIQDEEIFNSQLTLAKFRKVNEHLRREVSHVASSTEEFASSISQLLQRTADLQAQVSQMDSWILAHNVSAAKDRELLHEVNSTNSQLEVAMTGVQTTIANVTSAIAHLQNAAQDKALLLCPGIYRKVGTECLHILDERHHWTDARRICQELGKSEGGIGDLAQPENIGTFRDYLGSIETDHQYLWLGGVREFGRGWRWVTRDTDAEMEVPWDLGEPDNSPVQYQLCVRANANLKFHDCLNTSLLGAVCQIN